MSPAAAGAGRIPRAAADQTSIERNLAVIDHHDPAGQLLQLGHVVAGHHHGHALLAVQVLDEAEDRALCQHVQPERRLVQKQDLRLVQQRQPQLGAHLLAQAQLARQAVEELAQPSSSFTRPRMRS